MKSTHHVVRFDYSKIESQPDATKLYQYWGLHPKSGRIHIDTERYKRMCEQVGITEFMPEGLFANRSTPYFIPAKVKRNDYAVNIFRDFINNLKKDWVQEYKPVLDKIKTPDEVTQETFTQSIAYTSCSDDYDEIGIEARMAGMRRQQKYTEVVQSLYCQFITKICTEIDRCTLIVMCSLGYKGSDYNFRSFAKFSDGLQNDKAGNKLSDLPSYNTYNLLHKINNFLKHNTKEAYYDLKRYYPDNVRSVKKGSTAKPYENGMYAGDWIIVKDNYIDIVLKKLIKFFEGYCTVFVKEDINQAKWNYDEYFIKAMHCMQYPNEYFGLY